MGAVAQPGSGREVEERPGALLSRCGNPRCATSWMRLWRSRRVPAFEGRWACSSACMAEMVAAEVQRASDGGSFGLHPHRVPLGLILVEQGSLAPEMLRKALGAQRKAVVAGEKVLLGQWLLRSGVLSEPALTRALSTQWNCPIFSLERDRPEELAGVLPQLLSEALGAVPVRLAAGRLLYLAFADRIDRSLTWAVERVTGLAVAAGVTSDSRFREAQQRFLAAPAQRTRCLEVANTRVLARAITRWIEREKPIDARLARVHDFWWLRMRHARRSEGAAVGSDTEDVLCTVAGSRRNPAS